MQINGIEVKIIKKNIKNAHLYVKPPLGDVEVSCPLNYSDESVKLFVRTRLGWIKKQREAFFNQPRQTKRKFVSGETVYLFGKQFFLQVDYDSKKYNISTDNEKIYFVVRKGSTTEQRENYFNEWYRKQLKDCLDKIVPKMEAKSNLKCSGYSITSMQSKWGSCNTTSKKINLNLQLVKTPLVCIEYVVLHELAHTIEKKHNERFLTILDKYMPTWREVKQSLNSQTLSNYDL